MTTSPAPTPLASADNGGDLRPTRLSDFAGQPEATSHLSIIVGAARARGQLPSHLLFSGPAGLGKTTLAGIVAAELGVPTVTVSAPAVDKPGDIAAVLAALRTPSVVFVDEIHRLPIQAEEMLYSAMEDGFLDIVVGQGAAAETYRIAVKPFCLVGATTRPGDLSAPLRDRFGYTARLNLYDEADLTDIVARSAHLLGMEMTSQGAAAIAKRSRGTPRVANTWLRLVRDWAQTHGRALVDADVAVAALTDFNIDEIGLDPVALEMMRLLCTTYQGGPVGLKALAASLGEAESTLEEIYEPHLMRLGLLARTPRGRVATLAAFAHVKVAVPERLLRGAGPAAEPAPGKQSGLFDPPVFT